MGTLFRAGAWLVVGLVLLLFAQWPLREWVQAGARLSNDMGQILFALYAALAIGSASAADAHLRCGKTGSHAGQGLSPRERLLCIALVAPWALFVLWHAAPMVWASTLRLERFSDTGHPGYFMIKAAAALLVALAIMPLLRVRRRYRP